MKHLIKSALKYFGAFLLLYGVLTAISLVPAVGSFFNHAYRQATAPILQAALPKAYLQLKSEKTTPDIIRAEFASVEKVQQQLEEAKRTGQAKAPIQGNSFEFGFYNLFLVFFLFLVSLIALSPLGLREKGIAALLGSFLFYLFSVLKMYLALLSHFNTPELGIYATDSGALKLAESMLYIMSLGTNVLLVLVLWALFVFRRGNWRKMLG